MTSSSKVLKYLNQHFCQKALSPAVLVKVQSSHCLPQAPMSRPAPASSFAPRERPPREWSWPLINRFGPGKRQGVSAGKPWSLPQGRKNSHLCTPALVHKHKPRCPLRPRGVSSVRLRSRGGRGGRCPRLRLGRARLVVAQKTAVSRLSTHPFLMASNLL